MRVIGKVFSSDSPPGGPGGGVRAEERKRRRKTRKENICVVSREYPGYFANGYLRLYLSHLSVGVQFQKPTGSYLSFPPLVPLLGVTMQQCTPRLAFLSKENNYIVQQPQDNGLLKSYDNNGSSSSIKDVHDMVDFVLQHLL